MRHVIAVALMFLSVLLTLLNGLLIRPNDLVEFVGGLLGSVAMIQLGLGVLAFALAAGGLALERPGHRATRVTAIAVGAALGLILIAVTWRERGAYSRASTRVVVTGDTLTGTIYRPRGVSEPTPGVVVVHGSGDVARAMYHYLARRFAERGFTVLNVDKRGVGGSTGRYYGDDLGGGVISIREGETRAALAFLESLPGVDPKRIGLVTVSQGGWVMSSLLDGSSPASFAINVSGPAVSSGEEGAWSEWTDEQADHFGLKPPPVPFEELDRRLRSVRPSGYDPRPALATMNRPSLWLFGEWDPSLPSRGSIAVLDSLIEQGKPVTWRLFREANHGLFIARGPNGSRLSSYAPGVWDTVFAWTERQGITSRP